ncbi:Histone-lysine N-methyltransferase ASHR2 [Rhynchospora pubera]|uniref:Histone-lysine N-methyltransferase ASHR2 n=1 Tax=Rhynchospora pubera TaxID=906938 RepID=A0AAV8CPE5_9POAL|nr:Histone-lysine N-methyltransferase ASHR2 [Rhynchospora pubera]
MSSSQPNQTGPTPPPLVRPVEIPGRGRALVASGPIKPGQVVLTDSPLLLYPSSLASLPSFCSRCFRVLPSQPLPCSSCHVALFCSVRCLSLSHPPLLCHALPSLLSVPSSSPDLLFLLSAYSLPSSSVLQLLSLHSYSNLPNELTQTLHSQLCSLIPPNLIPMNFSHETTASLVLKEKVNSFCLMNPRSGTNGDVEEMGVRAFGIYPSASLFNHDCLPNVCRFDYIDDPNRENNTEFTIRALHEIAEGSEVCISYVRVRRGYRVRQRMLMEYYGFRCECDRCKIESQWKENQGDEEVGGDENGEEEMEEMEGENVEEGEEDVEGEMEMTEEEDDMDFPHQYFFLRYVCECGGTLAPLPPSHGGVPSDLMECNVCGTVKKDEFGSTGGA